MGRNFLSSSQRTRRTTKDASSRAFCGSWQNLPGNLYSLKIAPSSIILGLIILCGSITYSAKAQGQIVNGDPIILDAPHTEVPPPMESIETFNSDFKAKHERRVNQEEKKLGTVEERVKKIDEKTKNAQLVDEISQDKPLIMQMAASLVLPHISTSGKDRKNYTVEPTAHVHLYLRPQGGKLSDKSEFWTGFRLAPFAGAATYKNISGRYGFSYFGPMIGVGVLSGAPRSISKELAQSNDGPKAFHRSGYFLMGGIAAQSRESGLDKGVSPPTKELGTKGASYDAPGLWLEYTVVSMDYNAISYNYTLGVQTGEAKVFVYVGVGTGFWY